MPRKKTENPYRKVLASITLSPSGMRHLQGVSRRYLRLSADLFPFRPEKEPQSRYTQQISAIEPFSGNRKKSASGGHINDVLRRAAVCFAFHRERKLYSTAER